MMSRACHEWKLLRLVAVVCLLSTVRLDGQETAPSGLEFQRIAIPKGRIDEAGGELLPIDRDKFQQTIAELNSKYRALYGLTKPNIIGARYSARFEDGQLVNGAAELDVKHPHSEPAYLPLTLLGLATDSFHWKSAPADAAEAGLLATGEIGVLVTQSDTLTFPWSLRGTNGAEQEQQFRLSLPEATTSELLLDLPQGIKPECSAGFITRTDDPGAIDADGAQTSRWRIELGVANEVELRLMPVRGASDPGPRVMMRPIYDYRIGPTGLELRAVFRLDVQSRPVRTLTLQVDPQLRVAAVQLGGAAVAFATLGDEPERRDELVLDLPAPLVGGSHEVTVTAYAPAIINKLWTLPRVRLVDVLWRQGNATLEIVEPLRIGQLHWSGSALRDAAPLPAPTTGESRQFELLAPDASCEVLLTRHAPQLQARTGTTITLSDSIVTSQFIAQLSTSGGAIFSISLQRDPGWIVDSVETEPPQIDRVEDVRGTRGLSREVFLRTPITPTKPLKLLVKAHRRLPSTGVLSGLEMRPIALSSEMISNSRLTAVRAELPLRLDIVGDARLSRVTELSPAEKELVAADELVFRDGPNADRLRVLLRSEPPRYSGVIAVEASVESTKIKQSFVFRCEPMSTRVAALRVRFSPAPRDNMQWTLVGDEPGALTATRLETNGDEWDVRLRTPRNTPFEVHATLAQNSTATNASASKQPETIVLASLPDAESQVGTINIGTPDGSGFSLQHEGLRAIPTQLSDPTRLPTLRATYRYAPAQEVTLQVTRHAALAGSPDAWIWDAEATSRVDARGDVTHLLRLRIENVGAPRLTVEFPETLVIERVDVDGERIAASQYETKLRVPLPAAERFPVVRLRYRQEAPPLGNRFRYVLAMPKFDLRCLKRSWRVWVPPGYETVIGDEAWRLSRQSFEPSHGLDWAHRLFGFSILRRTGEPWNFTSLPSWTNEAVRSDRRQPTLRQLPDFIAALDAQLRVAGDNGSSKLTWDAALARSLSMSSRGADPLPLYVDCGALSEAGVFPESLVPSQSRSAIHALQLSGLVFIGGDDCLILTTLAAQAAGDYGKCIAVADRTFLSVSTDMDRRLRCVPASDWHGVWPTAPQPWDDGESDPLFEPLVGWANIRLPSAGTQAAIVLYRSEMVDTCAWAALFAAVACGIGIGRSSGAVLFTAVVVALAVALLIPVNLVSIARSVFLGLLAAAALLSLRRRTAGRASPRQSDESFSVRLVRGAKTVTSGLLLLAVLLTSVSNRRARGQERVPTGPQPVSSVFRVYDPVDSEGQPTGPRIYVPRTLKESLDSLKMTLGARQFGAILTKASYSLAIPDVPMATILPELRVEFECVSPRAGLTTIRVPLDREELQIIEATFDEQRVYPRWSPDGKTLEIDVETLDRHALRMTVRPVLKPSINGSGFDLGIPTIPNSRLSITGRDVAKLVLNSALGAVARTEEAVEAELGPTDRLAVYWPVPNARSPGPAEFTTSQLLWVHAESQAIAIDAQVTISVIRGSLTQVEFLVDPRLQLLVSENQELVTEAISLDDGLRRIRYQFTRAYEANEAVTINPSFVMTNVGESEVLTGPLVQLASGVVGNSLLAVSASPGMQASVTHEGDWPTIRPQDFAAMWGTTQWPKAAVQLPSNEAEWSLAVSPLVPQLSNADATELRVGRLKAEIAHYSQVKIADAPVLQFVLTVPSGMTVESVSVLQDDVDFARRYAKSSDGTLTVFLAGPLVGDVRVALRGSVAVPPRGQWSFTGIQLPEAATTERLLTVFRGPDVLVQAISNTDKHPIEPAPVKQSGGEAERLVGIYDLHAQAAATLPDITLSIAPNPARLSGRLVSTLHSQDAQWSVTADLFLRVSQGVVDSVRIRLPRELMNSLRLEPPLPYEVQDVPGQSEQNLIVTPPVAIDKELHITLDARLQTSPDGSLSAPPIEVLDTAEIDRFLVLPKRSGEQEIEWDIRGLEQPESDETQTTYRVRGRRMHAAVREVNQSAGNPRLRLADIRVAWQPDASYVGVANYDLEPGALTRCDLLVPTGVDMLHATVDDVPALLQYVEPSTATLELGAERLPQRIAILFAGHAEPLATAGNSLTLVAPSLRGLEPEKTLWGIRDPSRQAGSRPLLAHTTITLAAAEQLRVAILEEILKHDIGPIPQHRVHDLECWRTRWEQRLGRVAAGSVDAGSARFASVVSLQDGMNRQQIACDQDDWTYCAFDGPASSLTIIRGERAFSGIGKRLTLALAICVVAWAAWRLLRYEGVRDPLSRWPQLPGVLVGLAWWLWLSPSAVGWLIAALFLASSLRPAWRWRTVHAVR